MDITKITFGKSVTLRYKGKNVVLRVFNMQNGQIKFGIDAPSGISIHREEIYRLINEKSKPR